MRAEDVMSSPVHTVRPETPVADAAHLMMTHGVTALPVLDAAGELVGIVSEGDLVRFLIAPDPTAYLRRDLAERPVRRPGPVAEVMTRHPRTVAPDADLSQVATVMLRYDVRSLPVVAGGALAGIVSRRDLLRTVLPG